MKISKPSYKLFAVLEILCFKGEMRITAISKELQLGKSSVHRFISILKDFGYVIQDEETHKYRATLKLFHIGSLVISKIRPASVARPYMERLGEQVHETVNLALYEDGNVVYVDKVESVKALRMDLAVGHSVPAYCTALGKVFLAHCPEAELDEYLRTHELKTITSKTITKQKEFRKHLEKIRKSGYAIDDLELDEHIRCIAAPIIDSFGKTAAAVSVAGPSARLTLKRLKELSGLLTKVTQEISKELGYKP